MLLHEYCKRTDYRHTLGKPLLAASIKLALLQFGRPVGLKPPNSKEKKKKEKLQFKDGISYR